MGSMTPEKANRPRVGIPWRTSQEEADQNFAKIRNYQLAVEKAGGEGVLLSLTDRDELTRQMPGMDAFVLPGSPADVAPEAYGAVNKGKSEPADAPREETDRAILKHAFAEKKPVLAICYGCQLLNVYLGGTLIQDLKTELGPAILHTRMDLEPPAEDDPIHPVALDGASRLAKIAGDTEERINSSHHQSVDKAGRNLRVTAHAPDGTVEAVEWTGDTNWVVGVQWHPERMVGDAFSERLFRDFLQAAISARGAVAQKL